jgi:protein CpxP
MQPLMQELRQERQQMNSLTESGNFDEGAVRAAASKQAQTETDLAVERARVKSQIFAVLTPDQRTKAQAMEKSFAGHRGRWGHHKGAGTNQQPGAPGTSF